MQKSELKRFGLIMAGLGEGLSYEVSEEKIKIYAEALKEYQIQDIEQACWQLIKTKTFFPKPAEIIEAIRGIVSYRVATIKKLPEPRLSAEENRKKASDLVKKLTGGIRTI